MKTPHTFRAASNGKPFTRNEKIRIINSQNAAKARKAALTELVAIERNSRADEQAEKERNRRRLRAMIENPEKKIKINKDGAPFYQDRVKGRFAPAVILK